MKSFKTGDRVCLMIGSDEMVVTSVFGNSLVECEWVGKAERVYKHCFRPESLVSASPHRQQHQTVRIATLPDPDSA